MCVHLRISFNAASSSCQRGEAWQEASRLLSQLETGGLQANAVTYNVGVNACGCGQWMLAQVLLEKSEPTLIACNGFLASCEGALAIASK